MQSLFDEENQKTSSYVRRERIIKNEDREDDDQEFRPDFLDKNGLKKVVSSQARRKVTSLGLIPSFLNTKSASSKKAPVWKVSRLGMHTVNSNDGTWVKERSSKDLQVDQNPNVKPK